MFYADLEESLGTFDVCIDDFAITSSRCAVSYLCFLSLIQSTKAVYNRIIDLRIANPQIIINFTMFLEENHYFEEAFKVRYCLVQKFHLNFS